MTSVRPMRSRPDDGQQQGVRVARGELVQPAVGVAPERDAIQVRVGRRELGDPADGGGADAGARGQLVQGGPAGWTRASRMSSRSRNAAKVVPAGSGRSAGMSLTQWTARSAWPSRRAASTSLVKAPLPPSFGEVAHPFVAAGGDGDDLGGDAGVRAREVGSDALHLGEGHGRVAGDDADQLDGHGATIVRAGRPRPEPGNQHMLGTRALTREIALEARPEQGHRNSGPAAAASPERVAAAAGPEAGRVVRGVRPASRPGAAPRCRPPGSASASCSPPVPPPHSSTVSRGPGTSSAPGSTRTAVPSRRSAHIQERADEFFGPLAKRMDTLMSAYPLELLKQFEVLVTRMCTTMDEQLAEPGPCLTRCPRVRHPGPAADRVSAGRRPAPRASPPWPSPARCPRRSCPPRGSRPPSPRPGRG